MKNESKNRVTSGVLLFLIVLPYLGMLGLHSWYKNKVDDIANASFIVISKEEMRLKLVDYKGRELVNYPIACGKCLGNKVEKGDYRTPEGLFYITEIEKSDTWKHDFGDGNGEIEGAYGPFFMRLEVPGHKGIGIHGTHKPGSIGTRDTEGCIRLNNDDLSDLVEQCHVGMAVLITTSYCDVIKNGKIDSLKLVVRENDELNMSKTKKSSKKSKKK